MDTKRLRFDVEVILYLGELQRNTNLPEGTLIRRDTHHGEEIWKVVGGGLDGWYFAASSKWIREHTSTM